MKKAGRSKKGEAVRCKQKISDQYTVKQLTQQRNKRTKTKNRMKSFICEDVTSCFGVFLCVYFGGGVGCVFVFVFVLFDVLLGFIHFIVNTIIAVPIIFFLHI